MKLLTKELLDKIPHLYATEGQEDPIVWIKFSIHVLAGLGT
jgi:hypothetical protein